MRTESLLYLPLSVPPFSTQVLHRHPYISVSNGDIPTATLYEDDDFRVILDAGPAAKGHALIIPKEHYADLYELSDELAATRSVLLPLHYSAQYYNRHILRGQSAG